MRGTEPLKLGEISYRIRDWNSRVNRTSELWQKKITDHPIWSMVLAAFSGVVAANLYSPFSRAFCYAPFATLFSILWCVAGLGVYLCFVFGIVVVTVWLLAWIWVIGRKLHIA